MIFMPRSPFFVIRDSFGWNSYFPHGLLLFGPVFLSSVSNISCQKKKKTFINFSFWSKFLAKRALRTLTIRMRTNFVLLILMSFLWRLYTLILGRASVADEAESRLLVNRVSFSSIQTFNWLCEAHSYYGGQCTLLKCHTQFKC